MSKEQTKIRPPMSKEQTKIRNRIRDAIFKLPTDSEKFRKITVILGIATDQ